MSQKKLVKLKLTISTAWKVNENWDEEMIEGYFQSFCVANIIEMIFKRIQYRDETCGICSKAKLEVIKTMDKP